MNRRTLGLFALVAVALGLNLWHWWPSTPAARTDQRLSTGHGLADTLQVRVAVDSAAAPRLRRDLFRPPRVVAKAPPPKVEALPPDPPAKTPQELAEEAARAELAQIKLVGVVFRGENGEAFLVKGDHAYIARRGDKVGERFAVESVTPDGVSLKDPTTQVSGKMSVSGK